MLMRDLELSGYEVAEGEPDLRGWEVVGRDGRRIGAVEDVLVETETRQARFLRVRTEGRADEDLAEEAPPTGALEPSGIPELDRLSDGEEVIGHVTVPGAVRREVPARTIGEALVRDSLLDVENQMLAGELTGGPEERNGRLVPFEQAHLEPDQRRVRID
jgi:hypothetical protein